VSITSQGANGFSMQFLLRQALYEVLSKVDEHTDPRPLPQDF